MCEKYDFILGVADLILALVLGVVQIIQSIKMKKMEEKQTKKENKCHSDFVYSEATKFILKYSKSGHDSEMYLLPLCVAAYKYSPIYPYRREMYREFCCLTEEIQNEIIKRYDINVVSKKHDKYFLYILDRVKRTVDLNYGSVSNHFFYDNGKYLECALTKFGNNAIPDDYQCNIDEDEIEKRKTSIKTCPDIPSDKMKLRDHITNILAYHKNKNSTLSLWDCFQSCDDIIASYICCLVAEFSIVYNITRPEDENNYNYNSNYNGEKYMEDLFLEVLNTVENHK